MFIYVIGANSGSHKIGFARNCESRLRALLTGSPEHLALKFKLAVDKSEHRAIEARAHDLVADQRRSGEWFYVTAEEAEAAVVEAARQIRAGEDAPPPPPGPPVPEPDDLAGMRGWLGWFYGIGRPLSYDELAHCYGYLPGTGDDFIRDVERGRVPMHPPFVALNKMLFGQVPPFGIPSGGSLKRHLRRLAH